MSVPMKPQKSKEPSPEVEPEKSEEPIPEVKMEQEKPKEPTPKVESNTNANTGQNYLQKAKDELKLAKEEQASMQSNNDVQTPAIHPTQSSQASNESMEVDAPITESTSLKPSEPIAGPSHENTYEAPDSSPYIEPMVNFVGPSNDALVFSSAEESPAFRDLDDDFFNLKITDVKVLNRDLKAAAKNTDEGGPLMTAAMRKAQDEGAKLALLNRYRHAVLRIQFSSSRLVVQGVFSPGSSVQEVLDWLAPLLNHPAGGELYTAPPRTTLPPSSSLLDLGLLPAALVHFSSPAEGPQLSEAATESLSNAAGANMAAAKYRNSKGKEKPDTGLRGSMPKKQEALPSIMESRPGKRNQEDDHHNRPQTAGIHGGETKVPRWFKPGK